MKKYAIVYRAVLMETLQYAANVMMGFISYFIIIFVLIRLWNYMYREPGSLIAGYTREQMIWYVIITETLWFGARPSVMARQTASDIRSGNIAYQVNKPYYYPLYILSRFTGEWSIQLPMYAAFATLAGVLMVGTLADFGIGTFLAALPCIVLGITINGVFKLNISLISFWIDDSTPFQWLYDKLILVVGTIFPIEIFPAALQPLFKLTPIYTVCYGPAKLLVDFSAEKCLEILIAQTLYLAAGCVLMSFIYEKGVKKLYVNGG